ncbi:MAG: hypothetical protein KBH09_14535 [Saprospiraceae bacterium]|nr:hypothetical protein [Saprospiraceae bacterium]
MNFKAALIHGLIWALMWGSMVTFSEIKWPQLFLHDYPKVLQDIIHLPPFNHKRTAYIFTAITALLITAFIFWSGIYTYNKNPVSYWVIFSHILIVCMCWNIFDLIVMDWLIFCTWQPKFIVLPGSEGNKAYKNYKFHFFGFLKGCGISVIGSSIIAGICVVCLKFILW